MNNAVQEYDPLAGWHSFGDAEPAKPKRKRSTAAYDLYNGFDQDEIAAIALATEPILAPSVEEVAESLRQQIAANGGTWPFIEFADLYTDEQYQCQLKTGTWGDYYSIYNKHGDILANVGENVREKTVAAKGLKRITVHAPAGVEIRETAVLGKFEAVVVKVTPYIPHEIAEGVGQRWNSMRSSGDDGLL